MQHPFLRYIEIENLFFITILERAEIGRKHDTQTAKRGAVTLPFCQFFNYFYEIPRNRFQPVGFSLLHDERRFLI